MLSRGLRGAVDDPVVPTRERQQRLDVAALDGHRLPRFHPPQHPRHPRDVEHHAPGRVGGVETREQNAREDRIEHVGLAELAQHQARPVNLEALAQQTRPGDRPVMAVVPDGIPPGFGNRGPIAAHATALSGKFPVERFGLRGVEALEGRSGNVASSAQPDSRDSPSAYKPRPVEVKPHFAKRAHATALRAASAG